MTKKDIAELKRRFKKDSATFDKVAGCYVNSEKQKITTFSKTFLNLDENEMFKYLEIAKKTLTGKVGDNLLKVDFNDSTGEEIKASLEKVNGTNMDDELLEAFYDHIIANFEYPGNYLIVLFHDSYDVIKKTTDNSSLDESEEVYSYILCAICPVNLSKPGLGYNASDNDISAVERDWMVAAPAYGFMYPAFSDRSANRDAFMFYNKDCKALNKDLLIITFGGNDCSTATEYRNTFEKIIADTIDNEDSDAINEEDLYMDIQEALVDYADENDSRGEIISEADIKNVAANAGMNEEKASIVAENLYREVKGKGITLEEMIDDKAIKEAEKNREIRALKEQVKILSQRVIELEGEKK